MIELTTIKENIIIGCPIYNREWILSDWFNSIYNQTALVCKDIELIFAITDGDDNTRAIINEHATNFSSVTFIDCNDLPAYGNRNQARFYPLVTLRNRIIEVLREKQPEFYFSWDSDIMLPEDTLITLLKDDKDIVAPWVALEPKSQIPNAAHKTGRDAFVRNKPYFKWYPQGKLTQVDTVFGVSLIKNKVFNECLYKWHRGGEDYGWALEVLDRGFESWLDGRVVGTHIYTKI